MITCKHLSNVVYLKYKAAKCFCFSFVDDITLTLAFSKSCKNQKCSAQGHLIRFYLPSMKLVVSTT